MENDFNFIKKASEGARYEPSDRVWSSIEQKMFQQETKKKLHVYKYLSIAAVLIGVIGSILVVQLYTKQNNPDLFTYQESTDIRPLVIETLDDYSDGFYNIEMPRQLYASYQNALFDFDAKGFDLKSRHLQ